MNGDESVDSLGTGLNNASIRCSVVRSPNEVANESGCTCPFLSAYGNEPSSSALSPPTYKSSSRANRVLNRPLLFNNPETDARISPLRSGGAL